MKKKKPLNEYDIWLTIGPDEDYCENYYVYAKTKKEAILKAKKLFLKNIKVSADMAPNGDL